jgi:4-amino-4-deoxy-L-arabinose transferase-like glycosyltransferase
MRSIFNRTSRWKTKKALGVIAALALTSGILLAFVIPVSALTGDDWQYWELAKNIVQRGEFAIRAGSPTAWRSPGYPFFLAGLMLMGLKQVRTVRMIQVLLHLATAGMVYQSARKLTSDSIAMISAALVAFWPALLSSTTFVLSETLTTFLLMATIYASIRQWRGDHSNQRWAAASGLFWGLTALCHPSVLLVPIPFLPLALAQKENCRKKTYLVLVSLCCCLLLQAPWVIRNALAFHAFIPTNTNSGISLFRGSYVPWDGYDQGWNAPPLNVLARNRSPFRSVDAQYLNQTGRKYALQSTLEQPAKAAGLYCRKWARLWAPTPGSPDQVFGSQSLFYGMRLLHLLAVCLAMLVLFDPALYRRQLLFLFGVLLNWTLIHAFFEAMPRYALPVLPLILVLSSIGLQTMITRIQTMIRSMSDHKRHKEHLFGME